MERIRTDQEKAIRYLAELDLEPGATNRDIEEAYRVLVRVWHPDKHRASESVHAAAEAKLRRVNEAVDWFRTDPSRLNLMGSNSSAPGPSSAEHEPAQARTSDHHQAESATSTPNAGQPAPPVEIKKNSPFGLVVSAAAFFLFFTVTRAACEGRSTRHPVAPTSQTTRIPSDRTQSHEEQLVALQQQLISENRITCRAAAGGYAPSPDAYARLDFNGDGLDDLLAADDGCYEMGGNGGTWLYIYVDNGGYFSEVARELGFHYKIIPDQAGDVLQVSMKNHACDGELDFTQDCIGELRMRNGQVRSRSYRAIMCEGERPTRRCE